jgi:hypothetical protein
MVPARVLRTRVDLVVPHMDPVLRTMQSVPKVRTRDHLLMEQDRMVLARVLRTRVDPAVPHMAPVLRTMQSVPKAPLPAVGQKMVGPRANMLLPVMEIVADPLRNRPDGGSRP